MTAFELFFCGSNFPTKKDLNKRLSCFFSYGNGGTKNSFLRNKMSIADTLEVFLLGKI